METPILSLNGYCRIQHKEVLDKGFEPQNVPTNLMLIVSELGEALEADRKNRHADANRFRFASKEHINFEGALNDIGLRVRQELIWNKNSFIIGRAHYQWKHEPCLYGWKGQSCRYFIDARNRASVISDEHEVNIDKMKKDELREMLRQILADRHIPTTVINEAKPQKDEDHPTMKPVRLFGYQISNSSRAGEIILDTFAGSGTTVIACEQLNRKARLVELDPHYCDVIIARWEKFTGKKATLIPGEK